MRYIFCLLALLIQPVFSWYVYHQQDKRQAALRVPVLCASGVYLAVQIYVFIKYCIRFPEQYQFWAYLIQAAILIVFIGVELALLGSNRYIQRVEQQEQDSIRGFKELIRELEICKAEVSDPGKQKHIDVLLEKMRYSDPVSSSAVRETEERIHDLIAGLPGITEQAVFEAACDEIAKELEIRKKKNTKERG